MTFAEWKNARPVRQMFDKMDLDDYLDAATSWRSLRDLIVQFNDPNEGRFVNLVRECSCSSGERILLHAICYVTDFAWLADELGTDSKGRSRVWQDFDRVSGEHRRCVAACIGVEW
jgi:hypothetical protein